MLARIAADPHTPLRAVAEAIGITETAVAHIVDDLCQAGYLRQAGQSGALHYEVVPGRRLRHPSQRDIPVQALLDVLARATPTGETTL